MCLIVFALECHPRYRLVFAANRDEFFSRPSTPAGFWDDAPQVLAGRDLLGGGTWLGVTRGRRLAAVTNYRDPRAHLSDAPSRGALAADFLTGTMTPEQYLAMVRREGGRYNGFSLLFGDDSGLFHYSNRGGDAARIPPGTHGLSNHLLDTPWPKVVAARERLERALLADLPEPEALFALLADPLPFPEPQLPDTGVGAERERLLSPLFITGSDYGTRSSTIIFIDRENRVTFMERSYDNRQRAAGTASFRLDPDRCTTA
jgi:uncharacterized protein with NRDE domain